MHGKSMKKWDIVRMLLISNDGLYKITLSKDDRVIRHRRFEYTKMGIFDRSTSNPCRVFGISLAVKNTSYRYPLTPFAYSQYLDEYIDRVQVPMSGSGPSPRPDTIARGCKAMR